MISCNFSMFLHRIRGHILLLELIHLEYSPLITRANCALKNCIVSSHRKFGLA